MVKIEKKQPEPRGLAAQRYSGTYSIPSVKNQLRKDFHNKCYICGASIAHGYNIEHLQPHLGGKHKELKFDWNNLFLSCPNCNSIKNTPRFETNIIDCCVTDPEKQLRQEVSPKGISVYPRKTAPDPEKAERTAELISECFNCATDTQRAEIAAQKRTELKALAISLCKKLRHYRQLRDCQNRDEAEFKAAETEVLDMIEIDSEYAAFLRTLVRDRLEMFLEFEEIVGVDPDKERGA